MPTQERSWKVGELARETGLTVRALHHYEEKGLLAPSTRTEAGYRLYSPADVRQLYRVVALRQLGVPLERINGVLRGQVDLRELLQRQLAEVDRRLDLHRSLRHRLGVLVATLDREGIPTEHFLQTMEAMTKMDKYYTPEQQADLARRAEELGPEGLKQAEQDWADLIRECRAELDAGTPADDPRLKPLADRWRTLVRAFTGGDPGVGRGVARRYQDEGWEKPSRGMLDQPVMEYMSEAIQHTGGWA